MTSELRGAGVRMRFLSAGLAALAVLSTACGSSSTASPPRTAPSSTAPSSTAPPATTPVAEATTAPVATPTTSPVATTTSPVATTTAPAPAPAGLHLGPGTQDTYAVQAQPAPGSCHYRWDGTSPLPDPSCTPGALNPQVADVGTASTICRPGWTATVRPPQHVTGPEKAGSAAAYGYTGSFSTGEYDHLVPLELGGDPNDPSNLWLEPNDRAGATSVTNSKDGLENRLHELVCAGRLPLGVAQQAIASDWVTALRQYGS